MNMVDKQFWRELAEQAAALAVAVIGLVVFVIERGQ
jgi:hypothetical protein